LRLIEARALLRCVTLVMRPLFALFDCYVSDAHFVLCLIVCVSNVRFVSFLFDCLREYWVLSLFCVLIVYVSNALSLCFVFACLR